MNIEKFTCKKIRALREGFPFTQEEFANKIGISVSYLAKIELCKCSPKVSLLFKIGEVLNIKLSEFFKDFN